MEPRLNVCAYVRGRSHDAHILDCLVRSVVNDGRLRRCFVPSLITSPVVSVEGTRPCCWRCVRNLSGDVIGMDRVQQSSADSAVTATWLASRPRKGIGLCSSGRLMSHCGERPL